MESIVSKLIFSGWSKFTLFLKPSPQFEEREEQKPQSVTVLSIATYLNAGLLLISCSTLIGCATSEPLYYWGNYEDLIYQMHIKPGSADPATQVRKLNEDINAASSEGKPVPPGLHAHLGYMYFLQNDTQSAVLEFETEKKLFPESAKFVDGLMGRLKK